MPVSTAPPTELPLVKTPRQRLRYLRYEPSRIVGEMTVEQYLRFSKHAEEKHDYVYGKVVRVSGASFEHVQITFNLTFYLGMSVKQTQARVKVLGNDMRTLVRNAVYRFPDLIAVEGTPQVGPDEALRNPSVLFEVLSESTETDDRTDKFREYQEITSLQYYILVEQYRVGVTVYAKRNDLWAIVGDYTNLSETLLLTLDGKQIIVRLADIYEDVFDVDAENEEESATKP